MNAGPAVTISLPTPLGEKVLGRLKDIFLQNPGKQPIYLVIKQADGVVKKVKTNHSVSWTEGLRKGVEEIIKTA